MNFLKKLFDLTVLSFLAATTIVFSVLLYIKWVWPNADFEQISMTIKDLTPRVFAANTTIWDYVFGFLFFVIIFPLCYLFLNTLQQLVVASLLAGIILYSSGYIHYIVYTNSTSTLYEDHYIALDKIDIKFPEKKRNLILIYLESFENNFAEEKHYQKNLIPNLSKLQKEGEFSINHHSLPGSDYSIAALVASQCGIPLRFIQERDIWSSKYFLPQANCFAEVLKNEGYQTALVKAADITFTNADRFALTHGYNEALGVDEILATIPQKERASNIGTFEGVKDKTLLNFAKQKLASFDKDKPFMLTLFSLDTHTPGYFYDNLCTREFNDLRDIFMCSDQTISEFINWLKESPYWDNTTVVVIGDHLLPSRIKTVGYPKKGIYNAFLNLPEGLEIDATKNFSTYDITPTLLESLSIKLTPRAWGLGRSMFANEDTLVKKLGANNFKILLRKKSEIYNKLTTPKDKRINKFEPYSLGTHLSSKDLTRYSDSFDDFLNAIYFDSFSFMLEDISSDYYTVDLKFISISSNRVYKLDITANGKNVHSFSNNGKHNPPYIISFDIPKSLIQDGKLNLKLKSNNNTVTPVQMGINPLDFVISEKKQ